MRRDAVLQTPVQLSQEQIGLATRAIESMANQPAILVRAEDDIVDWLATAQRVLDAAVNVYVSLLLIQAKREHRGIFTGTLELARRRQESVLCLNRLVGKRVTAETILTVVSTQCGLEDREVRPLAEAIRRDLSRLQPPSRNGAPRSAKSRQAEPTGGSS